VIACSQLNRRDIDYTRTAQNLLSKLTIEQARDCMLTSEQARDW
jgi:hypothetical protein